MLKKKIAYSVVPILMLRLALIVNNSSDRAISSYVTQSVTTIEASPFRGATLLEHTLLK